LFRWWFSNALATAVDHLFGMMMASSDDEQLFQEMKVLAHRYGAEKCQKALDAAKLSRGPLVATSKKSTKPVTIHLPNPESRDVLMRLFLFPTDSKVNLICDMDCIYESLPIEPLLVIMEQYYESIVQQQQERPTGPSSKYQKVESRFHTLTLNAGQEENKEILNRTKIFGLFETISVTRFPRDVDEPPNVVTGFFDRLVDLVVKEGVISSLVVHLCHLDNDEALKLARLLKTNHLNSLMFSRWGISNATIARVARVGRTLTQSLRSHVKKFGTTSMLKELYLYGLLEGLDVDGHRDLFHAIGTLLSLESFQITIAGCHLVEALSSSIGTWKIRRFNLSCETWEDATIPDFRPLFEAIASSRYFKAFSFRCDTGRYLTQSIAEQVFHLALSPLSGLLDIKIHGSLIDLRQLSILVPTEVDATVAARRQLRTFQFVAKNPLENDEYENQVIIASMQALQRLLSEQLPYLYSFGLNIDGLVCYLRDSYDCDISVFRNPILVQLEKNHVGMALFDANQVSSSTVPAGLWPLMLHKAMTCDEDRTQIPWNGIYHMVQGIFQGGHTGWIEGDKKRGRHDESHDDDEDDDTRPKRVLLKF
jgi:hypothetical protein